MAKHRPLIVNISEAKAQLSRLVDEVAGGHEIILGKAGKPMVRMVRFEPTPAKRAPGALKGRIRIASDFDSLPADVALAFGLISKTE